MKIKEGVFIVFLLLLFSTGIAFAQEDKLYRDLQDEILKIEGEIHRFENMHPPKKNIINELNKELWTYDGLKTKLKILRGSEGSGQSTVNWEKSIAEFIEEDSLLKGIDAKFKSRIDFDRPFILSSKEVEHLDYLGIKVPKNISHSDVVKKLGDIHHRQTILNHARDALNILINKKRVIIREVADRMIAEEMIRRSDKYPKLEKIAKDFFKHTDLIKKIKPATTKGGIGGLGINSVIGFSIGLNYFADKSEAIRDAQKFLILPREISEQEILLKSLRDAIKEKPSDPAYVIRQLLPFSDKPADLTMDSRAIEIQEITRDLKIKKERLKQFKEYYQPPEDLRGRIALDNLFKQAQEELETKNMSSREKDNYLKAKKYKEDCMRTIRMAL